MTEANTINRLHKRIDQIEARNSRFFAFQAKTSEMLKSILKEIRSIQNVKTVSRDEFIELKNEIRELSGKISANAGADNETEKRILKEMGKLEKKVWWIIGIGSGLSAAMTAINFLNAWGN